MRVRISLRGISARSRGPRWRNATGGWPGMYKVASGGWLSRSWTRSHRPVGTPFAVKLFRSRCASRPTRCQPDALAYSWYIRCACMGPSASVISAIASITTTRLPVSTGGTERGVHVRWGARTAAPAGIGAARDVGTFALLNDSPARSPLVDPDGGGWYQAGSRCSSLDRADSAQAGAPACAVSGSSLWARLATYHAGGVQSVWSVGGASLISSTSTGASTRSTPDSWLT